MQTAVRDESEIRVWIVRFTDSTIASAFGTRAEAAVRAEEKAKEHGGGYEIID